MSSAERDPERPLESVHDLFARVREHPNFVFGTIFVKDDFPHGEVLWNEWHDERHAEGYITEAGFEYIENGVTNKGDWEPGDEPEDE